MGEEGPSKRRKSTESVVKEENSWDEAQSYRLSDKRRRELSMLMSIGTVVDTPIVDLTEDDSNEGQHPDIPTTSDRAKTSFSLSSNTGRDLSRKQQGVQGQQTEETSSTDLEFFPPSKESETELTAKQPRNPGRRNKRRRSKATPPREIQEENPSEEELLALPCKRGWKRFCCKTLVYYTTPQVSADSRMKKICSVTKLLEYLASTGETQLSMANFSFKPHLVGLGKEFETEIEDPVELGSRSNSSDVESEREDLIVMDTVTDSSSNEATHTSDTLISTVSSAEVGKDHQSSANQNLMNVTCESNSENGSEHSVDLCSIDGPACVTLSKGRKQPDVQCHQCLSYYHSECCPKKGKLQAMNGMRKFQCANCHGKVTDESSSSHRELAIIPPCTNSCPVPFVLKRPSLQCSGCDLLYHRQCAKDKGFVKGGKFICFSCVSKDNVSPEDLNQDFNSIPDFVHLPPRIQLAYSLPSSLENIASVSATPPGTLNNRLTCSISRTLSTVSTTPTVSQQSLSNSNRRQSSHPVSIAPAIVQLPATSITVPFISPFSAAQQPRMLVAVNNKPASVNQSNVRWPSVVSSSSPVSAVPVCRETLSVAQRQLGQRLSLQPYVSIGTTVAGQHVVLTQLSYQCANHLASTVQTTTGTQDTTELTTPLFPCLAVRSPPIVSTPLSVPMTSSSPIVSVTEAQSTTSSPRSSPATSGTPSHYQSSSLIAVRSSIPSQATIPTSFNVGEVESTTVSSTESARSNQVETSIASHTGQMCQLLRIIHVSSFVLQKIFQHLSVADLLRASEVCTIWAEACLDLRLWRVVRFGPGLNEMNSRFRVLDWPAAANFLKRRGTFSITIRNDQDLIKGFSDCLRAFSFIERLQIGPLESTTISRIGSDCPRLKCLIMTVKGNGSRVSLESFHSLVDLQTLLIEGVGEIENSMQVQSLQFLNNLAALVHLSLLDLTLTDENELSSLASLATLRRLQIGNIKWSIDRELPLASLSKLEYLKVEGPCEIINDKFASALRKLTSLKSICLAKFLFTKDIMDALCSLTELNHMCIWPDLNDEQTVPFWSTCLSGVRRMKNLSVLEFGLLSKCIFLNQTSEESSFPFVSLSIDDPTKLETIRVKQLLSFLCRELPKTRIRVQYVKSDVVQKTRELGSSVAEKCHNVGTSDAPGKSAEQEKIPTDENRFDGKEHWSEYGETVRKCRLCSSPVNWTYVSCKKCQVPLCFNKYRNCFNTFHRQQP